MRGKGEKEKRGESEGRRGKEGGEGMLEVIVQVGVANGNHQRKSFNLRSSTFLWGQVIMTVGVVVLCCIEHSQYMEIIYTVML